jgi:2-iminobutanoate/2-iminopropanoate deaminase
MKKQIINPASLAKAVGPFARSVRIGNILYVSGTSALSHLPGPLHERQLPPDFETQAHLTFSNIRKVLEAAGGTMDDIFKAIVMIKRADDYAKLNDLRAQLFPTGELASTAFVTDLIRDDMLIEVEVQALLR